MVLLLCATVFGVVMRYVVNNPLTWLEEVQMTLIIWLVFFGGSAAFRLHAHVSIEILVDSFPAWMKKAVDVFIFIVVTAVLLFIAYRGHEYIARLASGRRVSNVLRIPYALTYAAVPVGAVLMLLNFWASELGKYLGRKRGAVLKEETLA